MTIVLRRPRRRDLPALIFLLCLANAIWGQSGHWSLILGRHSQTGRVDSQRWSGIVSEDGWLMVAVRKANVAPLQPNLLYFEERRSYEWPSFSMGATIGQFGNLWPAQNRLPFETAKGIVRLPGLAAVWEDAASEWHNRGIAINWWWLVLLTSPALFWAMRAYRRQRKRGLAGLCLDCGYDLRASPERCPECRRRVEPKG